MEIFVYRNGSGKVEEGFTLKELPELLADETNVVWVDLQGETEEQIKQAKDILLNVFQFHYLTVEDCIETRNQPKIEAFPDYIYFIVHGVKPEITNTSVFTTKELDGYLGKNFVVTFHTERFQSIKTVKQQIRSSAFTCQRGADYLLHQILDQIVDLYLPLVDDFDNAINEIEERIFKMQKSNNEILEDILNLKRSIARLRRITSRQLNVLYRLSHGEFPLIEDAHLPFFRDVHDHLMRVADLAESYRDLISGLLDIQFSVVSNRTNEIMKVLTVFSAIILPLSLIAGIYGMNFDNIPELHSSNGYFMTIGAMIFIAAALMIYFWRKGWIFEKSGKSVE
jgi:magnesium transporter